VGRNLALPNSFFLNFTNNSSSDQTLNLFNQGGALQTPITNQQNLSTITSLDLGSFIDANGNVLVSTQFDLLDSLGVVLKTTTLTAGQNISLLNTALSPVTGTNGVTGNFSIARLASPLQKVVNVAVGGANANTFKVIGGTTIGVVFSQTTTSFVTANPLISLGGTIPYEEIENSQTGNAYKIMGVDVYSNQSNQLLQEIQFGMKDANGDKWLVGENPLIDPYQPSVASIQSVDTQGFTIDSETLFSYTIESFTFARLTFNYVRAQLSLIKEFDQAFIQQLTMESEKMKRILNLEEKERYILYQ
jgi:hypothetical protein